jgi:hypothetical protein
VLCVCNLFDEFRKIYECEGRFGLRILPVESDEIGKGINSKYYRCEGGTK